MREHADADRIVVTPSWARTGLLGEHGIGLKRRDLVGFFLYETQQELIRQVKTTFDPKGILNPLKIVPWTTPR